MTIWAIRHLITPWNQKGLLQGTTDIDLAENLDQNNAHIASIKSELNGFQFDNVFVSPMKRAVQTAMALGIKQFENEELITEISFGAFEGTPKEDMISAIGNDWFNAPKTTELGAEFLALEDRITQFLPRLSKFQNVLLISHGAYIRALKSYLESGSIDHMNQTHVENGQVIKLLYNV